MKTAGKGKKRKRRKGKKGEVELNNNV